MTTIETKINNWVEQEKFYGLDYSTAKAIVGDYTFDIRYDCCGQFTKKNGVRNDIKPTNCGLVLDVRYKNERRVTKFADSVKALKFFAECWLRKEVLNYYAKYCVMFSEAELRGTSN